MKRKLFLGALALLSLLENVKASPEFTYTAISSLAILSESNYKVAVTVEISKCPVDFEFQIVSEGNDVLGSEQQTLSEGTTATVDIEVGELEDGTKYNLTLKATSCGQSSQKSTRVQIDEKRATILIETDKPIYKGGETVKYRILVLNRFFQPFVDDKEIDLKLFDPQNNLINSKEGLVVPGDTGLVPLSFELAKEPNLGDWRIRVKLSESTEAQYHIFTVAEYVLPKFKTEIVLSAPFLTFTDSEITISVNAKYTFGKPVQGDCTLTVQENKHHYYRPWGPQSPVQETKTLSKTVVLENGASSAKFDLIKDLRIENLNSYNTPSVQIDVSCKDTISGHVRNESRTVTIYQRSFKVEKMHSHSYNPKPGLPHEVTLRVSNQDDTPISDPATNALVIEFDGKEISSSAITSGLVTFLAPQEHQEGRYGYTVQAKYRGHATEIYLSRPYVREYTLEHMQLKLIKANVISPRENGRIGLNVHATIPFKNLSVVIQSRRTVMESMKMVLGTATNKTDIFVTLPPNSAPKVEIVVFFTSALGEIVLDKLEVDVEPDFNHEPQISLDTDFTANYLEPGTNLTITVLGVRGGLMALKAVDQSVLLLKKENSIDAKRLGDEVDRLKFSFFNRNWQPLRGARETLMNSNLIILTNIEDAASAERERLRERVAKLERERQERERNQGRQEELLILHSPPMHGPPGPPPAALPPPPPQVSNADLAPFLPVDEPAPVRERSVFPETWIFEEHESEDGQLVLQKTLPDTITSWILTGYQISPELGIRLSPQREVTAFRPFFIQLNLPYSIVTGEVLALQVIVHNYMQTDLTARITLQNQDNFFKFVENETLGASTPMFKDVEVKASSVTSVTFPISPLKAGTMTLKASATSPTAGDAVKRLLIVKPAGIKQIHSSALLLNVLSEESVKASIKPFFPANRVKDADSVSVTVLGDIMGSTIENLDKLIRLPSGCGEQNMLRFVPNIVVLDYMTVTRQLPKSLKKKAVRFLEIGYQRELTYLRTDGSFSIWGNRDTVGSTWLTAFVVKSFISAKKYITIDTKIVDKSLKFLISTQQADGSFRELGFVHDKSLQGGAGSKHGLAAYILLTFVEARRSDVYLKDASIDSIINKGINFLIREELEGKLTEIYPLILLSHLLQSTNHESKSKIYSKVEKLAIIEESTNQKHWEPITKRSRGIEAAIQKSTSASVEMTSYALLTCLSREETAKKRVQESLPIVNWLLKHQNGHGGFESTQDTVMGITALAKMAEALSEGMGDDDSVKVQVSWSKKESDMWDFYVGKGNRTWVQDYSFNAAPKDVKFLAEGKGTALARVTWAYNVPDKLDSKSFTLQVQVENGTSAGNLQLTISASYVAGGKSNMAMVEVNAPSGFEFDYHELKALEKATKSIRRFEIKEKNTKAHFYFDYLDSKKVTFMVALHQSFLVAKHSSSYVVVYDYYDTTQKTEADYKVPFDLLCNLCKDDKTCKIPACAV